VRAYFAWRADRNLALPSPFADMRISVRVPRLLPRPIDRETLKAVLRLETGTACAVPSLPPAGPALLSIDAITILIVKLLVVTGLRVGELTGLRISDVSPDGEQITVHGKGNREGMVFVPNRELQEAFRRYCEGRCEHSTLSSPLFLNTQGRRLTSATFRKRLRVDSRRLEIVPHLTPHRFRHSAATLLIEEGIDIRLVQALLGHASITTTEIYAKVSNNALRAALARVNTLALIAGQNEA